MNIQWSFSIVQILISFLSTLEPYLPMPKEVEETKLLTEEQWIDGNNENIEPYSRSKALAEKGNFVNQNTI